MSLNAVTDVIVPSANKHCLCNCVAGGASAPCELIDSIPLTEDADLLLGLGDYYSNQRDSPSSATAAVLCYSRAVHALNPTLKTGSGEGAVDEGQAAGQSGGTTPAHEQDGPSMSFSQFVTEGGQEEAEGMLEKAQAGLAAALERQARWQAPKAS